MKKSGKRKNKRKKILKRAKGSENDIQLLNIVDKETLKEWKQGARGFIY